MGIFHSLDGPQPLSELTKPLVGSAEGTLSATARKERALANLGAPAIAELAVIDGVVAGTAQASKALVLDANGGYGGNLVDRRVWKPMTQVAPATVNATATMTAADLSSGLITSTSAAAVAATLPLGTSLESSLIAQLPGLAVSDSIDFAIVNTGPNAVTVTTNTGWTLVGVMVVATVTSAMFRARRTAANTYTLYRIS